MPPHYGLIGGSRSPASNGRRQPMTLDEERMMMAQQAQQQAPQGRAPIGMIGSAAPRKVWGEIKSNPMTFALFGKDGLDDMYNQQAAAQEKSRFAEMIAGLNLDPMAQAAAMTNPDEFFKAQSGAIADRMKPQTQTFFDPTTQQWNEKPEYMNVAPESNVFSTKDQRSIYTGPPKAPEPYNLGPGDMRFGPDNKVIARGPPQVSAMAANQEQWRPATAEDVTRYGLPSQAYLISNRGDVKQITDSRKTGQVPASVQVRDSKYLDELDSEAANALGLSSSMANWNEQAKNYGAQGEGFFNDVGQVFSMNTSKLKAATDEMTPKMREAGSGTMSDMDVQMYRNAVPNINNTPEGNLMVAKRRAAGAKRMQDHATFMRQWTAENPGQMNQAKLLWAQYIRQFPVYGPDGSINENAPDPFAWAASQGMASMAADNDDVSDLLEKYK